MTSPSPNRRGFLQATAAGVAAASIAGPAEAQQPAQQANAGGIPLRPLGKTGEAISAMALGGHASTNPQEALRGPEPAADPAGRR